MKLNKIAKLVMKAGQCSVYGTPDGRGVYISAGSAVYRADGLPMPGTPGQMLAMLDIPEKKREKLVCEVLHALPPLNMADTESGEMPLKEWRMEIPLEVLVLYADSELPGERRLLFADRALLEPIEAEAREYLGYSCRFAAGGRPYIVIKDGLYTIAAVMPLRVPFGKVGGQLAELESLCAEEAERRAKNKGGTV